MMIKLPENYTSRPATLADIPAAAALFNAYDQHYLGIQGFTENMLETEWTMPQFNPAKDICLVFNPAGDLVGYVEVWAITNPPVHPWVWGRVHPAHHRKGIGTYLLDWAENRVRQEIEKCPADARVAYRVGMVTTIEPPKFLYAQMGLGLIRHSFKMKLDFNGPLSEPVWPDGITIRAASLTDEDIEIVSRVDYEAFRDHFGHVDQPFEDHLARFGSWLKRDEKMSDASLWFLAMDGGRAVGLGLCARRDQALADYGHVNSLGVLRSHRQRGIGEALLRHAFNEYARRGYKGVTLGVDAENLTGALRLYQKVGMAVHRQFDLYEKELRPGVAYSLESL